MYNLAQENSHSPSSIQTNDQTRSLGCDYDNKLYYLMLLSSGLSLISLATMLSIVELNFAHCGLQHEFLFVV